MLSFVLIFNRRTTLCDVLVQHKPSVVDLASKYISNGGLLFCCTAYVLHMREGQSLQRQVHMGCEKWQETRESIKGQVQKTCEESRQREREPGTWSSTSSVKGGKIWKLRRFAVENPVSTFLFITQTLLHMMKYCACVLLQLCSTRRYIKTCSGCSTPFPGTGPVSAFDTMTGRGKHALGTSSCGDPRLRLGYFFLHTFLPLLISPSRACTFLTS